MPNPQPWPEPRGRIVIAGGSGFLGRNLGRHLAARGCEVVLLSRNAPREPGPWRHLPWDARTLGDGAWVRSLDGATGVVNLVGRTVDCVKTPDHCDEILRSRVDATRVLGEAFARLTQPPPVWVQMSTAHIYGDPPEVVCDETSSFGYGLAPDVGRAWEAAYAEARPATGVRDVVLRTTFVLGREGGAFPILRRLARLGLGGRAGHGRQGISWLHVADFDRIAERALFDPEMRGAYIASAPEPVANREFMATLRRALRMPLGLPQPAPLVRIGSIFLRTDPDLVLQGRYCRPQRLLDEGFPFRFATLAEACADLC